MENNFFNAASEAQINYLKRLGYTGETEGLTSAECSQLIKELVEQQAKVRQESKPTQTNQVAVASSNFEITTSLGTKIMLTRDSVDKYICKDLSDTEFAYLSAVCKNYGLNPYLKEIYAIKFGTQPATFIIDYKVLQQAADREPMYDGMKTGILYLDKNGDEKERAGAYILDGETLIGAWCEVYRKDRTHANKVYALFSECVQLTKDGKPNSNWAKKPVFMNVKVAKTWALRETFPNWFSPNTYTPDEIEPSEEYKRKNVGEVINVQVEKTGTKNLYEDVVEDDKI